MGLEARKGASQLVPEDLLRLTHQMSVLMVPCSCWATASMSRYSVANTRMCLMPQEKKLRLEMGKDNH